MILQRKKYQGNTEIKQSSNSIYDINEKMTVDEIIALAKSNLNTDKASGSNIHIINALNWPVQDIVVGGGEVTQVTTTGKNLYDGTDEQIIISAEKTLRYGFEFNQIGTFTLSAKLKVSSKKGAYKIKTDDTYSNYTEFTEGFTFTLASNQTLLVYEGDVNYKFSDIFEEIQIEQGSIATDYEPYTGGQASPSPDYPQEMVDTTGTQEVVVSNKNFFDYTKHSALALDSNGMIVATKQDTSDSGTDYCLEGNTQYTISLRNSEYALNGGGYSVRINGSFVNTQSNGRYTFTTPEDGIVSIKIGSDTYAHIGNYPKYIQINKGAIADYISHKGASVTLHLGDIYLGNLNGKSNDIRRINDKWYWHKEWTRGILDGTETWSIQNNIFVTTLADLYQPYTYRNGIAILCDKCRSTTMRPRGEVANGYIAKVQHATGLQIGINDTSVGTVADWQTKLINNPLNIAYWLNEPTDIEITEENYPELYADLAELEKKLQTYRGGTIITVTSESGNPAELEITYLKDDRVETNQTLADMQAQILALAGGGES